MISNQFTLAVSCPTVICTEFVAPSHAGPYHSGTDVELRYMKGERLDGSKALRRFSGYPCEGTPCTFTILAV